jgi:ABC-type transport system involved in cytochrome bd biosynthesis fused ATPase/permease subunit
MVQGDDASTLNLRELRGRFGVVPQNPVLFNGSIRDNLDPWGRASDEQLTAALQVRQYERCYLLCYLLCNKWLYSQDVHVAVGALG